MSGERIEVGKTADAPIVFSVAALYETFTDFFSAKRSTPTDDGTTHSLIMGRNRYELLKHGGFARPFIDHVLGQRYGISEWKYVNRERNITLKYTVKFYNVGDKTTNTDRVYFIVASGNENDDATAVTYLVSESTDPDTPKIMRTFFMSDIVGRDYNYVKVLDNPDYKLTGNVEPTAAAEEILYNAFFQCPYYDIEYVKKSYTAFSVEQACKEKNIGNEEDAKDKEEKKKIKEMKNSIDKEVEEYSANNEREIFNLYFQSKGSRPRDLIIGVNLKKLIQDDFYLQEAFCREIIKRTEVSQQAKLLNDLSVSNYEANLKLYCSAIEILNLIDSLRKDLGKIGENAAFYYYDNRTEFNRLATAYKDFLRQLIKLSLKGSSKKEDKQTLSSINDINKVAMVINKIPGYQTFLHVIAFLICGQEEETITLNQFKTLYNGVANSESVAFDFVERAIKGQGDHETLFLESLISSSIAFDREDEGLRLLNRDFWQKSLESSGVERSALFIPEEFKYDPEKFYSTCKNLLEEDKKVAESFNLDKLQLGSFAADRSDNIFNIERRDQELFITVDINEKEVGGHVVCPIPMFSGIYYKMIPNWDVTHFKHFCFSLKSADQSLKEIKLELKSTNRQEQANYHFIPSAEWVEHTVDIETIPHNIKAGLEEICFILVPTFFTRHDLTASFSLKDMRFE